jgi:hypothetical protein
MGVSPVSSIFLKDQHAGFGPVSVRPLFGATGL